jgi:threonine/homoserine/homoserine lactone efflux protein
MIICFLVAFFFSFIGSIPPATINLSVIQLGLEKKIGVAWRLALAASLVEYPYAWVAVKFENLITSSPVVVENFQLITAIVMIVLGILNLWSANKPSTFTQKFNDSGFRRGLILGFLNPLAMPFWIGVTAYVKSQGWIDLSTTLRLHAYLVGVSLGALCLLMLLAYVAKRLVSGFEYNPFLRRIPGFVMLALGIYALITYCISVF